ncbi:4-carboxymuconolactone decarboxylase [Rhizobium sp. PP-F2F-G48]|uniref:carboxymuconolactone decarboxylase family protein n=1 Tax=Rhizobium sp. PP-F2F-G48 TaxID=2135651 RepID=UPI0010473636|nr:carboxymuconolactone decarboxylase family protein [Rhizobium sp. PP-F2F-G48]TCM47190.1 4-carboxymuconolactone decarboxylase [Rhizobium sp. PP-F2F-G48]
MKLPVAPMSLLSGGASAEAQERRQVPRVAPDIVHQTTPGLGDYTDRILFADNWERSELVKRDRSLVTITALIATGQTTQLTGHLNRALDNGMTAGQIAGIITHQAFYAGWPRANSAVGVAREVFDKRSISTDQLAGLIDQKIDLDEDAEAARAAALEADIGSIAPALAAYTNDVLFGEVWRGAELSPRDRSLTTITTLVANGDADQLRFHIDRGLENGLSPTEISETITHLAFYAGWPRAMTAVAVAKAAFAARRADSGTGSVKVRL